MSDIDIIIDTRPSYNYNGWDDRDIGSYTWGLNSYGITKVSSIILCS
jgi:hypothetical protein